MVLHTEDPLLSPRLPTVLLELPISVVERTHLTRLQPSGNAVEVEGVLQLSVMLVLFRVCSRTLQIPQATVHSSLVAEAWLA